MCKIFTSCKFLEILSQPNYLTGMSSWLEIFSENTPKKFWGWLSRNVFYLHSILNSIFIEYKIEYIEYIKYISHSKVF